MDVCPIRFQFARRAVRTTKLVRHVTVIGRSKLEKRAKRSDATSIYDWRICKIRPVNCIALRHAPAIADQSVMIGELMEIARPRLVLDTQLRWHGESGFRFNAAV